MSSRTKTAVQCDKPTNHLAEQVQVRTLQGFKAGKLSITDIQQATLYVKHSPWAVAATRQAWQTALTAEASNEDEGYEQISSSDAYSQIKVKNSIAQIHLTWRSTIICN